ncbi:hypothetical protein PF003_g32411 [Phytophthora fragariae]|nr:hypothetical protein PF003_g32411 [Phytophthora fragariae]
MARGILQRAIAIISRHAVRGFDRAWLDACPRSAPAAASTTAVHGDSSDRGSTPGNGSDVLRVSSPAVDTSAPYAGLGAATFGLGSAGASQLPSVPTWTTNPSYGGATQAPALWPTPRMRTAIAVYGGYALQDVTTPKDPKGAAPPTHVQPPVTHAPTPATAPQRGNGNGGGNYGPNRRPGGSRTCWAYNIPDHYPAQCPTMKAFMQSTAPNAPAGAARQGPRGTTLGGYVARVLSEADDEDWNVPVNEDEAEASHTFDYNEETVENNYDNVEIWNRADESSAVRYEDELTTMETTNEERPVTMGYDTTTGERLPSERAAGVLTTEEVAYDPENDDIVNEESSERAPGVLTTEEVAFDLEQTYLRTEEPSERAIGELTTE